jgi:hypothetical protein
MFRKTLILFLIFWYSVSIRGQVSGLRVTWDYTGQSFNEFVLKTENQYPVKFFYREEWIKDLKLQNRGDRVPLSVILDNLFIGKNIYYNIDNYGNIILTKDYKIKIISSGSAKDDKYIPATDYSGREDQQKYIENILVDIGNPSEKDRSGNIIMTGYVRNKSSKEPVIGAAVYIKELSKGSITNEYGFYSINIPRGNYNIKYTSMGMKETWVNARVNGNGKLDVDMMETLIPLKETIVTADKNNVLERFEVGLEKLNMRTFRLMPTSMGETDILKSMLLLPGVKSVGEGSSGFNVRGGAADQNLILLYGAPVFNTSHFFGFFTAVNSDIIKDVLLYKGGIPAQYGGRISSVIDIIPRDGNKEEFKGNAGISPITAHILFEIPVIKGKMSLVMAARSTYSNWVLKMIKNQAIRNSRASFYDINGRMVYEINNNNKLELSSYLSHDSFKFNTDTTYNYYNKIVSFKWRHTFNTNFLFMLSANTSIYDYDIESSKNFENAFMMKHKLNYSNFKADFNWYQSNNQHINFGIDLNKYSVVPGEYLPVTDSSLIIRKTIEKEKAIEGALYIDDKINISDKLSLNLGLRYSSFLAIGPKLIQIYNPDQPMSQSTVSDTLNIDPGEIYKTYSGPEYRISLNIMLSGISSLKLNYCRTRQYLHLLTNTTSISPTDTWKLSDYYLKPQVGDQFSIGYYLNFPKKSFEWSAEAYYKPVQNMIDFKGGTILTMNEYIEKDIINISGKAYGLELMLKKSTGKVSWNLSYTYSRILVRSRTKFESEAINSGKWFPASYDKPNDFTMAFNYVATRRLSFSFNYTYNTGRPITYPIVVFQNANLWLVQYSDRNKYRIPDYSRLDFSARLSGNLKSKKLLNPYWTFSLFNVLGRANVYSVYFKTSGTTVKGYQLSVFARSIPTLTYSFDF